MCESSLSRERSDRRCGTTASERPSATVQATTLGLRLGRVRVHRPFLLLYLAQVRTLPRTYRLVPDRRHDTKRTCQTSLASRSRITVYVTVVLVEVRALGCTSYQ